MFFLMDQVNAVRLFFTPEDGDDPQSQAKRHFLQTGIKDDVKVIMNCGGTMSVCILFNFAPYT